MRLICSNALETLTLMNQWTFSSTNIDPSSSEKHGLFNHQAWWCRNTSAMCLNDLYNWLILNLRLQSIQKIPHVQMRFHIIEITRQETKRKGYRNETSSRCFLLSLSQTCAPVCSTQNCVTFRGNSCMDLCGLKGTEFTDNLWLLWQEAWKEPQEVALGSST